MKKRWIQLYGKLVTDIWLCREKKLERVKEIECCFQIAEEYRIELLKLISTYEFDCINEEIFFFKKLKPLFNAEIEYYGLCNYVELFKKGIKNNNIKELEEFYNKELQRMEKFSSENPIFCSYVKGWKTEKDNEWFTREARNTGKPEIKTRTSSLYDRKMGTYLALEKYLVYINDALAGINAKKVLL